MSDKELKLIESIKAESRQSAERNVNRAISLFLGNVGNAVVDGKTIREIVLGWNTEKIIDSISDILYQNTLDSELSAYNISNTPAQTVKNVQVQLNGKLLTHISTSSEEKALADPKVKSHIGDKRIVKTVIVQDKLVNLITE
jgi:hypothetical protein